MEHQIETERYPWQDFFSHWLSVKGVKAYEAARILGIGVSTAYEYTSGQAYPSLRRVTALASAMGVTEQRILEVLAREVRARRLMEAKRSA